MRELLIIVLNILRIVDFVGGVIIVIAIIMGGNIVQGSTWIIFCVMVYALLSKILEIVYSTYKKAICRENVIRFNEVGRLMLWFAALDAIVQYRYYSPFAFFRTIVGSIKISSIVYVIVALLMFLVAQIIQEGL